MMGVIPVRDAADPAGTSTRAVPPTKQYVPTSRAGSSSHSMSNSWCATTARPTHARASYWLNRWRYVASDAGAAFANGLNIAGPFGVLQTT